MFDFRLEFLLRYRRQKEEMAMYELAQRVREANEVENRLEDIRVRSGELARNVSRRAAQGIPVPILAMYKDYLEDLRQRGQSTVEDLALAEARIEEYRQKLIGTSVDRKAIEKLKEKQKEAYLENEARKEQNSLDEAASLAASRREHER